MERFEYPRVSPESVGIPSAALLRMVEVLEEVTEMHGIMVMRHGKICAEGWWSPYGPGVRHAIQSLSKTYTSTAIGIAYTEGILRLDEKLVDLFPEYLPEEVSENLKKLTIYDVLIMGNGMDRCALGMKDWVNTYFATPVTHVPGTTFLYNTAGSSLLGEIILKKTGFSLHTYLCEKLFAKIGIDAANIAWLRTLDGHEVGGGGILTTTEDNLRLMDLYRCGGLWQGTRILAEDFVQMATTKQIETKAAQRNGLPGLDHSLGYGFQMWMCQPPDAYRADGAFGQYAIVFPKLDMVVSLNQTGDNHDSGTQKPLDAIYEVLLPLVQADPLPQDEKAAAQLRRHLNTRSIPHPPYRPHSPLTSRINGVRYGLDHGIVYFTYVDQCDLSGKELSPGITDFLIHFGAGDCVIDYTEGGASKQITVAMDGTRRLNVLPSKVTPFSKLYASAYWSEDDTLCIQCRWSESCYEHTLRLSFTDTTVTVTASDLVLLPPVSHAPATFVRL